LTQSFRRNTACDRTEATPGKTLQTPDAVSNDLGAGIARELMCVSNYLGLNSTGSTDSRRGAFDGVDVGTRILSV